MSKRIDKADITALAEHDPVRAYQLAGLPGDIKRAGNLHQALCPLHADKNSPSFTIYPDGGFKCFGCGKYGDVIAFYQELHNVDFPTACEELGELLNVPATEAVHQHVAHSPRPAPAPEPEPLPGDIVEACHRSLLSDEKRLKWLVEKKALTMGIIEYARLGVGQGPCSRWKSLRYTIPVPDLYDADIYRDIRGYDPKGPQREEKSSKMLPWDSGLGRGRPRVYPWPWIGITNNELVWVEGEIDALNLIARGIPTVTATCGANAATSASLVIPDLTGKTIRLLFDADDAGRKAAEALPERLAAAGAARVTRLDWPQDVEPGYDISDYLRDNNDIGGLGL